MKALTATEFNFPGQKSVYHYIGSVKYLELINEMYAEQGRA